MLVLTRKANEQIRIGDNVVITILQVKGQTVRIGIEAPREVRVLRSELPATADRRSDELLMAPRPHSDEPPAKGRGSESQRCLLRHSPLLASAAPLAARVEHFRLPAADRHAIANPTNRVAVHFGIVQSLQEADAANPASDRWE